MSSLEIIKVLKDIWDEYGIHSNLTKSERNQVDMWLEAIEAFAENVESKNKKEVKND